MEKDHHVHPGRRKRTLAYQKIQTVTGYASSHSLRDDNNNPAFENFPFEQQFIAFTKALKKLKADKDTVNKIKREYVNTSAVFPVYKKCFGEHALAESTMRYRIGQIKSTEFKDDFIKLEDITEKHWEPKYYLNRLNSKLLKRIFLPHPGGDITLLAETTAMFEQQLTEFIDYDFEDDDDDF